MTEAARISETSVKFQQTTWRNILEDSFLYARRRENVKSQRPRIFDIPAISEFRSAPVVGFVVTFVLLATVVIKPETF